MADAGGLQLLPGAKQVSIKTGGGHNTFLIIGVTTAMATVAGYLWLSMQTAVVEDEIRAVTGQLREVENKRDKEAEERLIAFSAQIEPLVSLVDNHVFVSKTFRKLEQLIQGTIQVNGLMLAVEDGIITFSGLALNYTEVARQIEAFYSDPSVHNVTIGSLRANTEGFVEFDMEITVDPDIFFRKQNPLQ